MAVHKMTSRLVVVALVTVVAASLQGCGPLVSGANFNPTVKYKPSTTGATVVESTATTGTTAEAAATGGSGTLRGKVEFVGAFNPLPPLYVKGADVKDAAVCGAETAPDQSILVKDGGLANVFIFLKKAPKNPGPVPTDILFFDQKNCVFKPHAMAMRIGQPLKILNSDSVAHNTHTHGKKTVDFNSIVPPNDTAGVLLTTYKQAEQEPISVGCDIHPWMKAWHLPIDHPFVAVSGEDGTFEIKDVPAGKQEFKVWHEAGQFLEKSLIVTVKPGDNDPLTIKVTPSQLGK